MLLLGLFRRCCATVALIVLSALIASPASARSTEEHTQPRVLFLSKSSGYEHGVIKRSDGQPSHVETVLGKLAETSGFDLEVSKDASLINAANLENYDVVIFFTTGNLFASGGEKPGPFAGDGEPAMPKGGLDDLIAWIEAGGGFMGFHCATDTFKSADLGLPADSVTDYIELDRRRVQDSRPAVRRQRSTGR